MILSVIFIETIITLTLLAVKTKRRKMVKKILACLLIVMLSYGCYAADYVTTNYKLIVPETGTRDWTEKVSNDLITIDSILWGISTDMTIISSDISILDERVDILSSDVNDISNTVVIMSSDIGLMSNTLVILSNDVSGLNLDLEKILIISSDINNYTGPLIIVSDDVANISNTVVILSNDVANLTGVVQSFRVISGDYITGTVTVPLDNTPPTVVEGVEIISEDFTATSATNRLRFYGIVNADHSQQNAIGIMSLCSDDEGTAMTTVNNYHLSNIAETVLIYDAPAFTTNTVKYSLRWGSNSGGTVQANGNNGAAVLGGKSGTLLIIDEYQP